VSLEPTGRTSALWTKRRSISSPSVSDPLPPVESDGSAQPQRGALRRAGRWALLRQGLRASGLRPDPIDAGHSGRGPPGQCPLFGARWCRRSDTPSSSWTEAPAQSLDERDRRLETGDPVRHRRRVLAVPAVKLEPSRPESPERLPACAHQLPGLLALRHPRSPGEEHKSPEPRRGPWILGSGFSSPGRPGSGSASDPTSGHYFGESFPPEHCGLWARLLPCEWLTISRRGTRTDPSEEREATRAGRCDRADRTRAGRQRHDVMRCVTALGADRQRRSARCPGAQSADVRPHTKPADPLACS
jgi:hypothetical protein